jgi:hypothetical protein
MRRLHKLHRGHNWLMLVMALVYSATLAAVTAHVAPGSDRGQTGVRPGSDRGQTGVRPGSDQGQTHVVKL